MNDSSLSALSCNSALSVLFCLTKILADSFQLFFICSAQLRYQHLSLANQNRVECQVVCVIPVRVFCQPCSLSNLPHVFPITLFVFSNSSYLEPRLVCLVPCVFKPQSVLTPAITTLIHFQCRDPSTPVNLRFLCRHRFGFCLVPLIIRTSDSWFLTSTLFLFMIPVCPFVLCYIRFTDLDLDCF